LLAAAYEVTIALMMLSKGKYARWGLIEGIIFLIAITPLGVWTLANPHGAPEKPRGPRRHTIEAVARRAREEAP
jgi:hypothetical protein